jgi:hypothetical protein
MNHSEVLRLKIGLAGGAVPPNLARLWTHPKLNELFPQFLILLHQIIRASVPLMKTAMQCAKAREQDVVARQLVNYFASHIEEEAEHDQWLLHDLECGGYSNAHVLSQIPGSVVAALVGAQYYWVHHHHPVALLGYIAVLEGAPPTTTHVENLKMVTGLPPAMFRTYEKHGELDPTHRAEFDTYLDQLPLTKEHTTLLGLSAISTVQGLDGAVASLLRDSTLSDKGDERHA